MNRWHTGHKPIKKFSRLTVGGLVLVYIMLWLFMIMHTYQKNLPLAYEATGYTTGGNGLIYGLAALGGLAAVFCGLWMRRRAMCLMLEHQIRMMRRWAAK